jgi:hypothetical protein
MGSSFGEGNLRSGFRESIAAAEAEARNKQLLTKKLEQTKSRR